MLQLRNVKPFCLKPYSWGVTKPVFVIRGAYLQPCFILLPRVPYIKIVLFVISLSLLAKLSYLATLVGNSLSLHFLHALLNFCQSEQTEEKSSSCPVGVAVIIEYIFPVWPHSSLRAAMDTDILEGYRKPHLVYAARCQHPEYVSIVLYVAPVFCM